MPNPGLADLFIRRFDVGRCHRRGAGRLRAPICQPQQLEPRQLLAVDVVNPFVDQSLPDSAPVTIAITNQFDLTEVVGTVAKFETNAPAGGPSGLTTNDFYVELYDKAAAAGTLTPTTVNNFLSYAGDGSYDNTMIHRSVSDFVIQGGGFTAPTVAADQPGSDPVAIPTKGTITNEPGNSNLRGTIAMAKLGGQPNSATSQWYFNLSDNTFLDSDNGGYAVFGEVLGDGMTVVDVLGGAITYDATTYYSNGAFSDLPLWSVNADNILQPEDFVKIEAITALADESELMTFSVTTSDPGKLTARVTEAGDLELTPVPGQRGSVSVTVTATSLLDGSTASDSFAVELEVAAPGTAPVLDPAASPELVAVAQDAGAPAGRVGTLVAGLVDAGGPLDNVFDADDDPLGMAITGLNLAGGRLWFSVDDGVAWREITHVTDQFATVLYADAVTRLYYEPAAGFTGSLDDVFTFRAWDRRGGYANGMTGINTRSFDRNVGTLNTPGNSHAIATSADGRYAYLADGGSGLQVIDVSNLTSPTLVGTLDTTGSARDITLSADGRYAYLADGAGGLLVIDVAAPASPTLVGMVDTSGFAYGVTLSGDGQYAYVADEDSGLRVIDVSNPASPALVGTFDTTGLALGVTLSADGQYAYVADSLSGLQVVDVTDPASPALTGSIDTTGLAYAVTLSADGHYAYVADEASGLQVIDVSDPASPVLVGGYDTTGVALGVTLSADGRRVYVADSNAGVQLIDVTDPASPAAVGLLDTSGSALGMTLAADGQHALVADGSSGLQVIDVGNAASPTRAGWVETSGLASRGDTLQ